MAELSVQESTTVRLNPAPRHFRVAFQALERLAPRTAIRLATRIWCTPPRPRRPAATRPPGASRSVVAVDGNDVVVETWAAQGRAGVSRPGDATVYLVHGWGGWRGQLDAFVGPLVEAGYRVVSFDALGHGESARGAFGRQSVLPEMADTLAAVVRATGPAYGVVAHSLGASATALAVLDGLAVGRLVLIAPLADPPSYTYEFASALGFGERTRAGLISRVERMVGRSVDHFDLPSRLRSAAGLPPLLLVHDRGDKEVRHADAPLIAGGWPRGDLLSTQGLGHRRILRDPAVVERAVAFLAARPA